MPEPEATAKVASGCPDKKTCMPVSRAVEKKSANAVAPVTGSMYVRTPKVKSKGVPKTIGKSNVSNAPLPLTDPGASVKPPNSRG